MHLSDTCYFSYKMRMQYWIMSFLAFIFSWWFQLIWYSSKYMHRNQLKTQSCCSVNPIVTQEAQCFDQEWVSYHVFRREPFPSLSDIFSACGPFPLAAASRLWGLIPSTVWTLCLFALLFPCRWLPVPCCVRVLWGDVHVWLLCLILNLRWTSGNLLLFIKNDFG